MRAKPHNIVTIAEDVSGFAGLCRPTDYGGIGFDYRYIDAINNSLLVMDITHLFVHFLLF